MLGRATEDETDHKSERYRSIFCYTVLMAPSLDDRDYSSRDVQDAAGLTPRQQNDWDSRGLLPHNREGEEGWRRFSPREIFALMVCSEIRRRCGTPVERLRWVQEFMLEDGANHFEAAVALMANLGVGVWLCTDLENFFVMDSELEFIDLWEHGVFGADSERAMILLPINPLANRLLSCLKEPIELEPHGQGYEILREMQAMHKARNPEELFILDLIRSKEVEKVEVVSPDGEIKTIRATNKVAPTTRLSALLDEPYQRLTVTKRGGKIVNIEQEVTTKPKKADRK